jgi:hypothetical protein
MSAFKNIIANNHQLDWQAYSLAISYVNDKPKSLYDNQLQLRLSQIVRELNDSLVDC